MDQGNSEGSVIKGVTEQNPGFTTDAATQFTKVAENVFCPQHTGGAVAPPSSSEPAIQPIFPWPPPPGAS